MTRAERIAQYRKAHVFTLYRLANMLKALGKPDADLLAEIQRREERARTQTLDEYLAENYRPETKEVSV